MSLQAASLRFAYPRGDELLGGVDLTLEPGRFTCLLGANGCGKSTLLRLLAGMLTPAAGTVRLDDARLDDMALAARARRIGFLPQEVHPSFSYRVEESVALGVHVAGHGNWLGDGPDADAAVRRALDAVDAAPLHGRLLQELSGGERRRVLIAGVLAQEPDYLLLDEPAAMLDLHHQAALFRMLRSLAADGLGVLCVTHDWNLAARHADELVLLAGGRVAARGAARDVLRREVLEQVFGTDFELLERDSGPPVVLPA